MPIPPFEPSSSGVLPPGDWPATVDEIEDRFGKEGIKRQRLFGNVQMFIEALWANGVTEIWIGGSFVTDKRRPDDADMLFAAPAGSDPDSWGKYSGLPTYRTWIEKNHGIDFWRMPAYQRRLGRLVTIHDYFSEKNGVKRGLLKVIPRNQTRGGGQHDSQ
jgi:hypothetical protein